MILPVTSPVFMMKSPFFHGEPREPLGFSHGKRQVPWRCPGLWPAPRFWSWAPGPGPAGTGGGQDGRQVPLGTGRIRSIQYIRYLFINLSIINSSILFIWSGINIYSLFLMINICFYTIIRYIRYRKNIFIVYWWWSCLLIYNPI